MKRVIIHWTAGAYQPNYIDLEHYHYLINKDGEVIVGNHEISDNENCKDGNYAAHTGGGNTGSIGVAMCSMCGFKDKYNQGKYPMTRKQFETCCKLVAELCKIYKIDIVAKNVMTHYEFGLRNPNTTSRGKIDIIFLPPFPWLEKDEVGKFIRSKVRWYYENYYKDKSD